MAKANNKKRALFSLIYGVLGLIAGLFIFSLCFDEVVNTLPFLKSVKKFLIADFAITRGSFSLLVPALFCFITGLLSLIWRRKKIASFVLIPYSFLMYMTLLGTIHFKLGVDTPMWLMSRLSTEKFSLLAICLLLESVLFLLLLVVTAAIDDKVKTKRSGVNIRKETEEKSVSQEEEVVASPSRKEMKAAKAERKKALKEAKAAARLAEKQSKNKEEAKTSLEDKKEEVIVKVNAKANATLNLDPNAPIEFPEISKLPDVSPFSGEQIIADEEKEEFVVFPSQQKNTETSVNAGAFQAVKAELERKELNNTEEKEEPETPKIDISKPQTYRKGGMLEATLESVSRQNNTERVVNRGPIIGYDDVKKEEPKVVNKDSFAPSTLPPSHPRYKLFESLRRKKTEVKTAPSEDVSHFPGRPFEASAVQEEKSVDISLKKEGVPESLSEAIQAHAADESVIEEKEKELREKEERLRLLEAKARELEEKEAEIRALEEKQRALEEKTRELENRMRAASSPVKTRYADTTVKSEGQELERSSSYYQSNSTAQAVNGAVIDDVKKVEVEATGSDLIEFRAGIGGLASNNAGESAIMDRARRGYTPPPENILKEYPQTTYEVDEATYALGLRIVELLHEFKIDTELKEVTKGPTITLFEYSLAPGVHVSKVLNLKDNISMRLGGKTVRILAPVPGKDSIGVEIPNQKRSTVGFRELLAPLREAAFKVPMILGRDTTGNPKMLDVAKTPHLLIAGTTGSGKSVCINGLIASLLYTKSPKEVRLLMVDPKIVELQVYNGIPHLLTPVITEPKRVLKMLDWLVDEMERRYHMFAQVGVRNIEGFNGRIHEMGYATEKMPYIVLIMDEFADLMTVIGKDIESYVARLMAKARAAGIHCVMATQRPSAEVVTGTIKSNIPSRISFAASSGMNSRIILDATGAEDLLGRGDMLYMDPTKAGQLARIQGAFLSDDEVETIVRQVKLNGEPDYLDESIFEDEPEPDESFESESALSGDADMYEQAKQIVFEKKGASASYLQRRLGIGYNRAAKLVEQMEDEGIVGPANGSKPREILRYE